MNAKNIIVLSCTFLFQSMFAQIGNVGVNTNTPVEKLHVKGSLRLDPNAPVVQGSYLVSDASGNATWQNVAISNKNYHPAYGQTPYEMIAYNATPDKTGYPSTIMWLSTISSLMYTGTYIDLPAGKWLVMFNNVAQLQYTADYTAANPTWVSLPADKSVWVRSTLSDDTTSYPRGYNMDNGINQGAQAPVISPDIYGPSKISNVVSGPAPTALIFGEVFVNNKSGATKRYYVKVNFEMYNVSGKEGVKMVNFGLTPNIVPETKFIAYPVQ